MAQNTSKDFKEWQIKALMHKTYFDTGYGETSYFKYAIAVFGLTSNLLNQTIITFILYGIGCYIFGWAWYRYGWAEARAEIGNRFNLFMKEVRGKLDLNSV